jgi:hypothetical protein
MAHPYTYIQVMGRTEKLTSITKHCILFHGVDQPATFYFFAILQFCEVAVVFEKTFCEFPWGTQVKWASDLICTGPCLTLTHLASPSICTDQVAGLEILNDSLYPRGLDISSSAFWTIMSVTVASLIIRHTGWRTNFYFLLKRPDWLTDSLTKWSW